MRVLVLDGNENQSVAAVRSLARAGHRVSVGAHTAWSKAGWSRFSSDSFRYTAPEVDAESFVARVVEQAAREPGTLVLPMTERTTLPLSRDRVRIAAAAGHLVLPSHDTVVRAFDKQHTTTLAASIGLAVPKTVTLTSEADVLEAARTLSFPVVVKPRSSEEATADGRVRTTGAPLYARDRRELLEAWSAVATRCRSALAQEFVAGSGVGYFALMHHGALRAEFAHRRIRDVRPTGSGSAVRESAEVTAALRAPALAMLQALGWHGVAMVEFRLRADGTPVFLEVNGRFWNSLALAVHAGVDFPALLAAIAAQGDVSHTSSYKAGVRCRWLLGDLRHLVEVWRGAPAQFPGAFPGRWATLAAVLTPHPGTFHDNFAADDPLPELGDWIDFALRRVPRRARALGKAEVWHAARRPTHS